MKNGASHLKSDFIGCDTVTDRMIRTGSWPDYLFKGLIRFSLGPVVLGSGSRIMHFGPF